MFFNVQARAQKNALNVNGIHKRGDESKKGMKNVLM